MPNSSILRCRRLSETILPIAHTLLSSAWALWGPSILSENSSAEPIPPYTGNLTDKRHECLFGYTNTSELPIPDGFPTISNDQQYQLLTISWYQIVFQTTLGLGYIYTLIKPKNIDVDDNLSNPLGIIPPIQNEKTLKREKFTRYLTLASSLAYLYLPYHILVPQLRDYQKEFETTDDFWSNKTGLTIPKTQKSFQVAFPFEFLKYTIDYYGDENSTSLNEVALKYSFALWFLWWPIFQYIIPVNGALNLTEKALNAYLPKKNEQAKQKKQERENEKSYANFFAPIAKLLFTPIFLFYAARFVYGMLNKDYWPPCPADDFCLYRNDTYTKAFEYPIENNNEVYTKIFEYLSQNNQTHLGREMPIEIKIAYKTHILEQTYSPIGYLLRTLFSKNAQPYEFDMGISITSEKLPLKSCTQKAYLRPDIYHALYLGMWNASEFKALWIPLFISLVEYGPCILLAAAGTAWIAQKMQNKVKCISSIRNFLQIQQTRFEQTLKPIFTLPSILYFGLFLSQQAPSTRDYYLKYTGANWVMTENEENYYNSLQLSKEQMDHQYYTLAIINEAGHLWPIIFTLICSCACLSYASSLLYACCAKTKESETPKVKEKGHDSLDRLLVESSAF